MIHAMALTVTRPETVHAFLDAAGGYLGEREAEHSLLFGISSTISTTPDIFGDEPPRFAVVADDRGIIKAATLQTPPYNLVLSMIDDAAVVDALAEALRNDEIPGVLGPKGPVQRFAAQWTAASGRIAQIEHAERIYRLERVIPPRRPATGAWRVVEERDRDILARWLVDFRQEAAPESPPINDPGATAGRWIAAVNRTGYLWEDDGQVVSMVGAGGETPNGVRIGPVYTPPEWRGRGYASSLTAAATQDQLNRGRRFVFLFTDLANPTSNRIYQALGYEPVCDVDQYLFADA